MDRAVGLEASAHINYQALMTAMAMCWFLLLPGNALEASEPITVVDLLTSKADRDLVTREVSRALERPVTLQKPDTGLLEMLRWYEPTADQRQCSTVEEEARRDLLAHERVHPPARDEALLPLMIEQARVQLQLNEYPLALQSVQSARGLVPCLREQVDPVLMPRLLWYEALAHAYLKDGLEEQSFLVALRADLRPLLPSSASKPMKDLYARTQKRVSREVSYSLSLGGFTGPVFVNGKELADGTLLLAGEYLVQARGPGNAWRSAIVDIPGEEPIRLGVLFNPQLATQDRAKERLIESLTIERLADFQRRALDAWLEESGTDVMMVFALESAVESRVVIRTYERGRGLGSLREVKVRDRGGRGRVERRQPAPAFGLGFSLEPRFSGIDASEADGYQGVTLQADLMAGRVLTGFRVGYFRGGSGACTTCQPWALQGGVGAQLARPVGPIFLLGGLFVEGGYFSNLAVRDDTGTLELVRVGAGGPGARLEVRTPLIRRAPSLEIAITAFSGAWLGYDGNGRRWLFPLGGGVALVTTL